MGTLSIQVSTAASRKKMLVAGPQSLVVSNCTQSKYTTFLTLLKVIWLSSLMHLLSSYLNFNSMAGFQQRQYNTIFVNRLVRSLPAVIKAQNSQIIYSYFSGFSSAISFALSAYMAQRMSVYLQSVGLAYLISPNRLSIILLTSFFTLAILAFSLRYLGSSPQLQGFSPRSKIRQSVDCFFASFITSLMYLYIGIPSTFTSIPYPPKKHLITIVEIISSKIGSNSNLYEIVVFDCSNTPICCSTLSKYRLQISFILGKFRLIRSKLNTSEMTLRLCFQIRPQFNTSELPSTILKPYLLTCDLMKFFSLPLAKKCLRSRGLIKKMVTLLETLLITRSQCFQTCFSSWQASPYSFSLCLWFSRCMIRKGWYGNTRMLYPSASKVSRYHLIVRPGLILQKQQEQANETISRIRMAQNIIRRFQILQTFCLIKDRTNHKLKNVAICHLLQQFVWLIVLLLIMVKGYDPTTSDFSALLLNSIFSLWTTQKRLGLSQAEKCVRYWLGNSDSTSNLYRQFRSLTIKPAIHLRKRCPKQSMTTFNVSASQHDAHFPVITDDESITLCIQHINNKLELKQHLDRQLSYLYFSQKAKERPSSVSEKSEQQLMQQIYDSCHSGYMNYKLDKQVTKQMSISCAKHLFFRRSKSTLPIDSKFRYSSKLAQTLFT